MKNILYTFMVLIVISSCKKNSTELFFGETPEHRMHEKIDSLNKALISAEYGWKATLPTDGSGGFSFYMQFDKDQVVKMISDISTTSATVLKASNYRVKQDIGVALIFDTYNYISIPADPASTLPGSLTGYGLFSDNEFIFDYAKGDTLSFIGKKNRQSFKLIKSTADEKSKFLSSTQYIDNIVKTSQFFATTKNPYIDVNIDGKPSKLTVSMTNSTKQSNYSYLNANNGITNVRGQFVYGLNGGEILNGGDIIGQYVLTSFIWENDKLYVVDNKSAKYEIKSSNIPVFPFTSFFAYNKRYTKITLPANLPAGVTSEFNDVYTQLKAAFSGTSRTVTGAYLTLTNANVLVVGVTYSNAAGTIFTAEAFFNYTLVDNILTLNNTMIPGIDTNIGNWTTRAVQLKPLQDYITSGPFKIDWVTSTVNSSSVLGGLYRVSNPNSFLYGTL